MSEKKKPTEDATRDHEVPKFARVTPILVVTDVARSSRYYVEVLGFKLLQTVERDGEASFAILQSGGVEWMLQSQKSFSEDLPSTVDERAGLPVACYIDVPDIQKLYGALEGKAEIVKPLHRAPHGLLEFYLRDPNGHLVGFSQPE